MARKMRKLRVKNRIFGYKAGVTFLAVKEYWTDKCLRCGHRVAFHDGACMACDQCPAFLRKPLISFAIECPPIINHRIMRKIILERITGEKTNDGNVAQPNETH